LDGLLQFRYWLDGNNDGVGGAIEDTLLRTWTDLPELSDAPIATSSYVVEARCSSDPDCRDTDAVTVPADCPASGKLGGFPTIVAPSKHSFVWQTPLLHDFARGSLAELPTYLIGESGTGIGPAEALDTSATVPLPGTGLWYLFRQAGPLGGHTGYCNSPGITWGDPVRDAGLP
jgi:hypothetical protein